jgi:hypothetical protein
MVWKNFDKYNINRPRHERKKQKKSEEAVPCVAERITDRSRKEKRNGGEV